MRAKVDVEEAATLGALAMQGVACGALHLSPGERREPPAGAPFLAANRRVVPISSRASG